MANYKRSHQNRMGNQPTAETRRKTNSKKKYKGDKWVSGKKEYGDEELEVLVDYKGNPVGKRSAKVRTKLGQ